MQVDVVGEIEAAVGLDDIREQADDVAILLVELELHLGLVLLEIFRAHVSPRRLSYSRR
jgi:hypothetical protein